ncbi:MAG: M67 family metallopeptidase [Thermoguttaceae bacterium]|nr:M67 family metallopeptidase [Thermoguttaceae bacterium]
MKKVDAISISARAAREIARAALTAYPRECCGLALGRGRDLAVVKTVELVNRLEGADAERGFAIDPLEIWDFEKKLAKQGLEIVGTYHSHPDQPAILSARDEESMPPGLAYLIVSVAREQIADARCFMKTDPNDSPVELRVELGTKQ